MLFRSCRRPVSVEPWTPLVRRPFQFLAEPACRGAGPEESLTQARFGVLSLRRSAGAVKKAENTTRRQGANGAGTRLRVMAAELALTLFLWWLGPVLVLGLLFVWSRRATRERRRQDRDRHDRTRYP